MNEKVLFKEVLAATDLFVCSRGYENALVTSGLLLANKLRAGVIVLSPDGRGYMKKVGDDIGLHRGPRARVFLVGFESMEQSEASRLVKMIHASNRELVAVYNCAAAQDIWRLALNEVGLPAADWMPFPDGRFASLGSRALKDCEDAELLSKVNLSATLFKAAAAADHEAVPSASLFASIETGTFNQSLGYAIHGYARNRFTLDAEAAMHARVACMIRSAEKIMPGFFHTALEEDAKGWSGSGGMDSIYLPAFLREAELNAITVAHHYLLDEERELVPALSPQGSSPLAKYGWGDNVDNGRGADVVRLFINRERFNEKEFVPQLAEKLRACGFFPLERKKTPSFGSGIAVLFQGSDMQGFVKRLHQAAASVLK